MTTETRTPPAATATEELTTQRVFEALVNERRRTILTLLQTGERFMTSGEIAGHFDCSWQTISRHLRLLEVAGLVSFERRGRDRAYTIQAGQLRAVTGQWLAQFAAAPPRPVAVAAGAAR
jgi:DNA-binding transcriptional ArsR family regulator